MILKYTASCTIDYPNFVVRIICGCTHSFVNGLMLCNAIPWAIKSLIVNTSVLCLRNIRALYAECLCFVCRMSVLCLWNVHTLCAHQCIICCLLLNLAFAALDPQILLSNSVDSLWNVCGHFLDYCALPHANPQIAYTAIPQKKSKLLVSCTIDSAVQSIHPALIRCLWEERWKYTILQIFLFGR